MAEALWHFNASLMSVIHPPRKIFSSLQGTVTRELSLMAQLILVRSILVSFSLGS